MEDVVNTRLAKGIDRLSVILKSHQSDKIQHNFFPNISGVHTNVWMHNFDAE